MEKEYYRDLSKKEWFQSNPNVGVEIDQINCGSLQRIADACEKMAASYDNLRSDRDRYRQWYIDRGNAIDRLNRRIASLRGVITKMKKKGKKNLKDGK
jgi:hypothetical protein